MLGRVKKWLGIEGVKVEIILPDSIKKSEGKISGTVKFSSMHAQTVTSLHFKIIEKYRRGRRKNKRTDEYVLAEEQTHELIEVPAEGSVERPFTLSYDLLKSPMDEVAAKNFIFRGVVNAAKALKSVKSEFRVEVVADVVGTALNPFDKQIIDFD